MLRARKVAQNHLNPNDIREYVINCDVHDSKLSRAIDKYVYN